jgi:hypothetical protein
MAICKPALLTVSDLESAELISVEKQSVEQNRDLLVKQNYLFLEVNLLR